MSESILCGCYKLSDARHFIKKRDSLSLQFWMVRKVASSVGHLCQDIADGSMDEVDTCGREGSRGETGSKRPRKRAGMPSV